MSKVFFSITASLDGFMAPEWPIDKRWLDQWMRLQDYVLHQRFIRRNLKLGDGGETGVDNQILEETFNRTGVTIIGKRMFDAGEPSWPDEAPFHTPVFVLTKQKRDPWPRPGGTVFHFVNDGIESALRQAREVANGRDIRIGGGALTIQQFLNAGLVDEFHIAVAPVLLHSGLRVFDRLDPGRIELELAETIPSPRVTHLKYRVVRR
jgi:dihydrofolate reductase